MGFPDEYYTHLTDFYRQKRDTLEAVLREVGFRVYPSHGAYYLMTDIADFQYPGDDLDFALWLTGEVGVATVPGRSFYRYAQDSRTKIRFCYCKRPETLDTAAQLLRSMPSRLVTSLALPEAAIGGL